MAFTSRPYFADADLEPIVALLQDVRCGDAVYRYPTLWRLRQLTASRLWEPECDARLWLDEDGSLVAFALLTRRRREQPGSALDYVRRPLQDDTAIDRDVLAWAKARTRQLAAERGQPFHLDALGTAADTVWIRLLEAEGFSRYAGGYNPYYARALSQRDATAQPLDGFTIRPLAPTELDQYEALYGFTSMGRHHREDLMRSPEYCHLVAVAPGGALAGYCECSYSGAEWARAGRRIAWIDYIGVDEGYLRRGLGRALMVAAFEQMRAWGAEMALLVTSSANAPAVALYQSLGMREREQEYAWVW
jgi:ribosomal protein S18 acetylase RimI-like enzyme